jgi:hypothetical protein
VSPHTTGKREKRKDGGGASRRSKAECPYWLPSDESRRLTALGARRSARSQAALKDLRSAPCSERRPISGITGIALRVFAASGPEFAPDRGGSGGTFGKHCHVLDESKNRPARRISGISGIAFRVIATSSASSSARQEFAPRWGNSRPSFGKECHVLSGTNNHPARGLSGITGTVWRVFATSRRDSLSGAAAPEGLSGRIGTFSGEGKTDRRGEFREFREPRSE